MSALLHSRGCRLVAWLLLAAASGVACTANQPGGAADQSDRAADASPGPATPASSGPMVASLQAEPRGDSVRFVFQITNTSRAPVTFSFPSAQRLQVRVRRPAGEELWRSDADQIFAQVLGEEGLRPGATLTQTAVWRPPAGVRGDFVAEARLTTIEPTAAQSARFQLP